MQKEDENYKDKKIPDQTRFTGSIGYGLVRLQGLEPWTY